MRKGHVREVTVLTNNKFMIGKRIVEEVRRTCRCQADEARELIGTQIEKLCELSNMGQLRQQDFELACAELGISTEFEAFFMENID